MATNSFVSENKSSELNLSGHSGRSGTLTSQRSISRPARSSLFHDWYDDTLGISMDAAEGRLLSTPFITSHLKDSSSFCVWLTKMLPFRRNNSSTVLLNIFLFAMAIIGHVYSDVYTLPHANPGVATLRSPLPTTSDFETRESV